MTEVVRTHRCGVLGNDDFICVETWSGYRSSTRDPKGVQHFLSPDASDRDLGAAVLDALAHSRFVLGSPRLGSVYPPEVEFDKDLYDYDLNNQRYAAWVEALKVRYGYKTKRALFKDMKNCGIESSDNVIKIRPMRHEKLEGWGRTKGDGIEDVLIPSDSSADKIGEALRVGFSRCL